MVLAVYLLQARRFARPLLIAVAIYGLPLGLLMIRDPFSRSWLASADTGMFWQTLASLVALVTLIVAALLDFWRRRDSTDSGAVVLESAT